MNDYVHVRNEYDPDFTACNVRLEKLNGPEDIALAWSQVDCPECWASDEAPDVNEDEMLRAAASDMVHCIPDDCEDY